MSLFNFSRFTAFFIDDNDEQVGFEVFGHSYGSRGQLEKTFKFKGRAYNIKPTSTRLCLSLKTSIFFDTYIYLYRIGHPDPLKIHKGEFKPMFDPLLYKELLENKQTIDLIKAGKGGLNLDWRIIVGGIVVLAIIYFIFKGNASPEVVNAVNDTINQTINPASLRGSLRV